MFQIPIPLYRALAAMLLAGAVLLTGESSRAMLARARVSCFPAHLSWLVLWKQNETQPCIASVTKYATSENKGRQPRPGLVAFHDYWPGDR